VSVGRKPIVGGQQWHVSPEKGDLIPLAPMDPAAPPGIGSLDASPQFVSVGGIGARAVEGLISARAAERGGGVILAGFRGEDASGQEIVPNATAEVSGSAVLFSTNGGYLFETDAASPDNNYAILSPSYTDAQGRIWRALSEGPTVLTESKDEFTDATDHVLPDGIEVPIVSGAMAFDHAAGSIWTYGVNLSEEGGRTVVFDVVIYVDGVEAMRRTISLFGTSQYVTASEQTDAPVTAGQVIEMRVEATNSNPGSNGWVRGTVVASKISIESLTPAAAATLESGDASAIGFDSIPAVFMEPGATPITNAPDTIPLTNEVEDPAGAWAGLIVPAAGTYQVSYSVPVSDLGTGPGTRARIFAWVEANTLLIAQSRSQDYAREASGGEGLGGSFVATLAASAVLRLRIQQSAALPLETETGQAQLSIHRIR